MKKFILILILLLSVVKVNALVNDSKVRVEWIPNVYYNYEKSGIIYWGQLGYIYANDTISYCYDIDKNITTNTYSSSTRMIDFSNKVVLSAYFGYGYKDNNKLEDYMATQQLIWEDKGVNLYFTTKNNGEGNVIDVSSYKNKILNYIKNYGVFPKLDGLKRFQVGSTNIVTATNRLIDDFIIRNDSANLIELVDKWDIKIKANKVGEYTFYLDTNYNSRFLNKSYTATDSQTLIQVGTVNNTSKMYLYFVGGGSAEINLYDLNTKTKENTGASSFAGNIFKLYDSNNILIYTYETIKDGELSIKNLDVGTYTLEHSVVSEGYNKTNSIYTLEIKEENMNPTLDIYLEPKKTSLNIQKTYGNPILGTVFYDDNVEFEIVNSVGEIVNTITTNEFGKCNIELFYDNYIIRQVTTNNISLISNNYEIKKEKFNRKHNYNIFDEVYETKVKLYLYEGGTSIPIKNAKIYVNDDKYITNNEGYIITEYKGIGSYIIKKEKMDLYYDTDDVILTIDKDSRMYLENNEVYFDVVLYIERIPIKEKVELNQDTPINNKNTTDNMNTINDKILIDNIKENETVKIDVNNTKSNNQISKNAIETQDSVLEIIIPKEENTVLENDIQKLPNLGIYDYNILYMIVFILKIKYDKKNNL